MKKTETWFGVPVTKTKADALERAFLESLKHGTGDDSVGLGALLKERPTKR